MTTDIDIAAARETRPHEFVIGGIAPCEINRGYYVGSSDFCNTHGHGFYSVSHGGDFHNPRLMRGDYRTDQSDICPIARITAWKARRYLAALGAES